jgi:hypothetical protein
MGGPRLAALFSALKLDGLFLVSIMLGASGTLVGLSLSATPAAVGML